MASTRFSSIRAAPVQSVQELIKEPIPAVPQPFILDDPQPPILSASTPLPLLPTIDMKHIIMSETADSELEKLHSTCKEWGFFQVSLIICLCSTWTLGAVLLCPGKSRGPFGATDKITQKLTIWLIWYPLQFCMKWTPIIRLHLAWHIYRY